MHRRLFRFGPVGGGESDIFAWTWWWLKIHIDLYACYYLKEFIIFFKLTKHQKLFFIWEALIHSWWNSIYFRKSNFWLFLFEDDELTSSSLDLVSFDLRHSMDLMYLDEYFPVCARLNVNSIKHPQSCKGDFYIF